MYKRREKEGIIFLKKKISCFQTECMGKCISGIATYKHAKPVQAEAEWKMCNVPNSLSLWNKRQI